VIGAGMAIFRHQISGLLSKVGGGGQQVSIPQLPKASPMIEAAEEMVAERLAVWKPQNAPTGEQRDEWQAAVDAEIETLAMNDEYPAEYCLLRTWSAIERLARLRASLHARAQGKKYFTVAELAEALKLDAPDKALVRQLRDIRQKAADGELAVSQTDAIRYRDLVLTLLRALRDPRT
jgi:hypothetical protein